MIALLSPRTWLILGLAACLAFSHGFAYRAGRAAVRADFDAYKITQAEAISKAQAEAEALRETHRTALRKADATAQKRIAAGTAATLSAKREIANAKPDTDCRAGPRLISLLNSYANLPDAQD